MTENKQSRIVIDVSSQAENQRSSIINVIDFTPINKQKFIVSIHDMAAVKRLLRRFAQNDINCVNPNNGSEYLL